MSAAIRPRARCAAPVSRDVLSPEASRAFWDGAAFAERFFVGLDEVHQALRRLTSTLEADGIPYAIAGAMALNAHGYRRVTTDVGVLFTREGLARFKALHLGRGWVEKFPGSKASETQRRASTSTSSSPATTPATGSRSPSPFPTHPSLCQATASASCRFIAWSS